MTSLANPYSNRLRILQTLTAKAILASQSIGALDGVQSGGSVDLYFALVDKYGTVVKTDSSSKLFIRYI